MFARAIVALHKDADGKGAEFRLDLARGSADAAFEFVADHSHTAADVAFLNWTGSCGINGMESVFGLDVKAVDVVEPAIPCFRDDGQRPPITGGIGLAVRDTPLNDSVANDADAVRVGDHYRTFEEARLFDPGRAGHFTIAVERPPAGENGIVHRVFSAREHGGHSRSNRPLAYLKFSFALIKRGVADGDAGNVGDSDEHAARA